MQIIIFLLVVYHFLVFASTLEWPYALIAGAITFIDWCWRDRERWRRVGLLSCTAFSMLIVGYWCNERSPWCTALFITATSLVVFHVRQILLRKRHLLALSQFALFSVIGSVLFWLSASTYDYLKPIDPLKLEPSRLRDRKDNWPDVQVAIALSGGGYRAAFMHAGVLDAYEKLGVKINTISAVSGGSLIGSYYAAGGAPCSLFKGLSNGSFNLWRRVFQAPNLFHLALKIEIPLAGVRLNRLSSFTRTSVQTRVINDVVLNGTTWKTLKENDAPRLVVGTTDLLHGGAIGFSADGYVHRRLNNPIQSSDYQNVFPLSERYFEASHEQERCQESLAQAVAASGAFPFAFPSVSTQCKFGDGGSFNNYLLSDGGVADNLGLNLLIAAGNQWPSWQADLVIVSDAGSLIADLDPSSNIFLTSPDNQNLFGKAVFTSN